MVAPTRPISSHVHASQRRDDEHFTVAMPAIRRAVLAAALANVALAVTTTSATHTSTKSGTPSAATPTQTPTGTPIPILTPEQWAYYDLTVPSPTAQPVILWRSSIDGELYSPLNNTAPADAPSDAATVWNAWNSGTPYPNVATQGSNDPAGATEKRRERSATCARDVGKQSSGVKCDK